MFQMTGLSVIHMAQGFQLGAISGQSEPTALLVVVLKPKRFIQSRTPERKKCPVLSAIYKTQVQACTHTFETWLILIPGLVGISVLVLRGDTSQSIAPATHPHPDLWAAGVQRRVTKIPSHPLPVPVPHWHRPHKFIRPKDVL